MKAMLFAAGLGTRLKPFTDKHPKALAQVNGKTLLEWNLRYLQSHGIDEVIVNVHHFADQIEDVLIANKGFGSKVAISNERDEVLETGGGLKKAGWFFEGEKDFVVMNVDALTNLDLQAMVGAHRQSGSIATLGVMKRESSRYLLFDERMQLCGWQNNKTGEQRLVRDHAPLQSFAFTGIQVLSAGLLQRIRFHGKFSTIDVYLDLAWDQKIIGYDHSGDLFIDVGKPDSLEKAAELFRN